MTPKVVFGRRPVMSPDTDTDPKPPLTAEVQIAVAVRGAGGGFAAEAAIVGRTPSINAPVASVVVAAKAVNR